MSLAGLYLKDHQALSTETQSKEETPALPDKAAMSPPDQNGYREPVTDHDREQVFNYMAAQNPNLKELAKTFELKTFRNNEF